MRRCCLTLLVLAGAAAGSLPARADYRATVRTYGTYVAPPKRVDYRSYDYLQLFQFVAPPTTYPPVVVAPPALPMPDPLASLRAEIAELKALLAARQPSGQDDSPPVAILPGEEAVPETHGNARKRTDDPRAVTAQAIGILAARCADCHTGPAGRGKVNLLTASGTWAPDVTPEAILASLTRPERPMPLNRPSLSPAEVAAVEAWARTVK